MKGGVEGGRKKKERNISKEERKKGQKEGAMR